MVIGKLSGWLDVCCIEDEAPSTIYAANWYKPTMEFGGSSVTQSWDILAEVYIEQLTEGACPPNTCDRERNPLSGDVTESKSFIFLTPTFTDCTFTEVKHKLQFRHVVYNADHMLVKSKAESSVWLASERSTCDLL